MMNSIDRKNAIKQLLEKGDADIVAKRLAELLNNEQTEALCNKVLVYAIPKKSAADFLIKYQSLRGAYCHTFTIIPDSICFSHVLYLPKEEPHVIFKAAIGFFVYKKDRGFNEPITNENFSYNQGNDFKYLAVRTIQDLIDIPLSNEELSEHFDLKFV